MSWSAPLCVAESVLSASLVLVDGAVFKQVSECEAGVKT